MGGKSKHNQKQGSKGSKHKKGSKPKRSKGADPGKCDLKQMSQELAAIGMELNDVVGDGNCLFRAVADQLEGNEHGHAKFREQIVEFIRRNKSDFEFFVEDDEEFDEYLDRIAQDGEWGGQLEISAVSRLFNLDIVILQLDHPSYEMRVQNRAHVAGKIYIYFQTENHFVSVRPKGTGKLKPVVDVNVETILNENTQLAVKRPTKAKKADTDDQGNGDGGGIDTNNNANKENEPDNGDADDHNDDNDNDNNDGDGNNEKKSGGENNAHNHKDDDSLSGSEKDGKHKSNGTHSIKKLSKRDKKQLKQQEKMGRRKEEAANNSKKKEKPSQKKNNHREKEKDNDAETASEPPQSRISNPILV